MKAVCIENTSFEASLEVGKKYDVIPDFEALDSNELRVVDESGEDYLYPRSWFVLMEAE